MGLNRRRTHAAFLALMAHFEGRLRSQVVIDKNRFIRAAAERYAEHGTASFFDLADTHRQAIQATLKAAYAKIVPAFGRHAIEQVRPSRKSDEDEEFWLELALDWVNREGLKRSHLIADTTESDVLDAISRGLDGGLGTAEIARNIRRVRGLSGFRADLIARTETHAAATFASIETVRNAESTLDMRLLKEWAPTLDARTREDHAGMAGSQPIPLEEKFLVGGVAMDRPGDPAGGPEQCIGCRCTLIYQESQ